MLHCLNADKYARSKHLLRQRCSNAQHLPIGAQTGKSIGAVMLWEFQSPVVTACLSELQTGHIVVDMAVGVLFGMLYMNLILQMTIPMEDHRNPAQKNIFFRRHHHRCSTMAAAFTLCEAVSSQPGNSHHSMLLAHESH